MTETISHTSLGSQAPALAALARVAELLPQLPPAYLVFGSAGAVIVQLEDPAEVEAWREALHVAPQDVVLKPGTRTYLEFKAEVSGVKVDVYAAFEPVQAESEGAAA